MIVNVGKARIEVDVQGCVDCGTRYSIGWHPVEVLPVVIGRRNGTVTLWCCEKDYRKRAAVAKAEQELLYGRTG